MNKSIMIVGVGGQGTLLASRILGNVAVRMGYDVKMSEVHGMAQRGGSVVTYVKIGNKVNSPIIEKGEADVLLCFEKLEAFRWMGYLKKDGDIIINDQRIDPMPVIIKSEKYPKGIIQKVKKVYKNVEVIDALEVAKKCGNVKVVNTIMVALLAKKMNIPKNIWLESIKSTVKPQFVDVNLKAFEEGYKL